MSASTETRRPTRAEAIGELQGAAMGALYADRPSIRESILMALTGTPGYRRTVDDAYAVLESTSAPMVDGDPLLTLVVEWKAASDGFFAARPGFFGTLQEYDKTPEAVRYFAACEALAAVVEPPAPVISDEMVDAAFAAQAAFLAEANARGGYALREAMRATLAGAMAVQP